MLGKSLLKVNELYCGAENINTTNTFIDVMNPNMKI